MKYSDKNSLKYCQEYIFDSTYLFFESALCNLEGDKYMILKILK